MLLYAFKGGNTSKTHDYYRVLYKVSLYTFYQRNHMWFITIIGKLSYAKYITITSYFWKWKMLLYMYKSNTLLILYVYVSNFGTTKVILFITSEHYTRVYYTNETNFWKNYNSLRQTFLHVKNSLSNCLTYFMIPFKRC